MFNTPALDTHKILFLSKEHIIEKTGVSAHTLQNWINTGKPTDTEFETLRGGRRSYSIIYIEKIFRTAKRDDLLPKLQNDEALITTQVGVDQSSGVGQGLSNYWLGDNQPENDHQPTEKVYKLSNSEVIELVNQKWEASVAGKEEVITLLKEQLESANLRFDLKDVQIADLSRNLNQQQVLQMETVREVTRLREENQKLLLSTVQPIVDDQKVELSPTPEVKTDKAIEEPVSKKGLFARIFG